MLINYGGNGMQKLTGIFCLVIPLMVLAFVVGCGSHKNNAGNPQEETPVAVSVVTAVRGDISSYIHTTGTVYPVQEAFLSPKIGGRIERIFVEEGDRISAGQRLVQLEQSKLIMAKNEAAAVLNTAQAELRIAQLNLANIKKNLQRMDELHRQKVIDDQKYDDAKTEYLNAEAQQQLSRARVEQAAAHYAQMEQDLADSVVYAPFSGFVVAKLMNEGEMVYTMTPSKVLHITDLSRVKIECPVAEAKKPFIHPGKTARIDVDALHGEQFVGTISTVNPLIDASSRTFKVKIEIDNPHFKLESGMFARIKILEQEKKDVVLVPLKSVLERNGKKVLFIVENNRARIVPVEPGIHDHTTTEICSGLAGGEQVVSEGFYALTNEAPVVLSPPVS